MKYKIKTIYKRIFSSNSKRKVPFFASCEDAEMPVGCMNRYDMLNLGFKYMYGNHLKGDYFEFGCWTARTFRMAYELSRKPYNTVAGSAFHKPIHLYAFDSFEGLKLEKKDEDPKWKKGKYTTGLKEFETILQNQGIKKTEYTTIKGFYDNSLTKELQDKMVGVKAGLIYIDCDLYESTFKVLNFIVPFLQTGTVICFDDYWCFQGDQQKGECRAINDFIKSNKKIKFREWHNYSWAGRSYIVNINE